MGYLEQVTVSLQVGGVNDFLDRDAWVCNNTGVLILGRIHEARLWYDWDGYSHRHYPQGWSLGNSGFFHNPINTYVKLSVDKPYGDVTELRVTLADAYLCQTVQGL